MRNAKIRVFRCIRLQGPQLCYVSKQFLALQESGAGSLLVPVRLGMQLHVCNTFIFDLYPLCSQGRQAHQEKRSVKAASVDSAPECFRIHHCALLGQQFTELPDVQATLGNGILQQFTGHGLPEIGRIFVEHFYSRFNFFNVHSLREYVVDLKNIFHSREGLIHDCLVTKVSPLINLKLYFPLEAFVRGSYERSRSA